MVIPKTAKTLFSNTFFQLLTKFITMSVTIFTTVVITRFYGKAGYGDFNLMQNFPAIFFVIVDFGLNAIATKEITRNPENSEKWFSNIFWFRTIFSTILIAVLWVVLNFMPYSGELRFGIQIGLFIILTQAFFNSFSIIYQSKLRYDLASIGSVVGTVAILLLVLTFSYLKLPISIVNFSYIVGGFIALFINLIVIQRLKVNLKFEIDYKFLKNIFLQSLPLGLMFVFSQINFKADSILLSFLNIPSFLNLNHSEVVAVYGLPYKIFEVFLVLPTFYMNSLYPLLVLKSVEGPKPLYDFFIKNLLSLFGAGVVIGVLGFIFSGFIIDVLGGSDFGESVAVGQILLGCIVIFFVTQPLAWMLILLDKQILLPFIYLISAMFNVIANYILIPRFSFYGSAVITVISELIILIFLIVSVRYAWRKKYEA